MVFLNLFGTFRDLDYTDSMDLVYSFCFLFFLKYILYCFRYLETFRRSTPVPVLGFCCCALKSFFEATWQFVTWLFFSFQSTFKVPAYIEKATITFFFRFVFCFFFPFFFYSFLLTAECTHFIRSWQIDSAFVRLWSVLAKVLESPTQACVDRRW